MTDSLLGIAAATATAIALGLFFAWLVGDFVFAVVIGYLVGRANLWVRSRLTDAAVNSVISFTVPFVAAVPSELLGASGLVAAVVAGLVTGRGAIRNLSPQHRTSDMQNSSCATSTVTRPDRRHSARHRRYGATPVIVSDRQHLG